MKLNTNFFFALIFYLWD